MSAFATSADIPPASNDEDNTVVDMDEEKSEEGDEEGEEEGEEDEEEEDEDEEEDDEDIQPMDVVQTQIQRDRYYTIVDPLLSLAKKEHYLLVNFWKKVSRDVAGMTAIELDAKGKLTAAQRAGKRHYPALHCTALNCAVLL